MRKKILILFVGIIVVVGVGGFLLKDNIKQWFFKPTESKIESGIVSTETNEESIEIVAENLDTPWGLVYLPNGDLLVSERSGSLKRIGQNGQSYSIEGVKETSEGGLLGVALHPKFADNNFVYLYITNEDNQALSNKIDRYELVDDTLVKSKTLIENIPGSQIHDGGRIAFGPDGYLYVTTGDAGVASNAQDVDSLAGKILRMTDEGAAPEDNPFGNYTYSYGHRNPQGIAWDDQGRLWETEHGPSGTETGNDELNLIEKGGNYGWPNIKGQETAEGMIVPIAESGKDETWAPGGLAFADGSLFFAGLRGQTLYQAKISGNAVELKAHFREEYGRLRTTEVNNGFLYITTSNKDGRGQPGPEDDRIIKASLEIFR